MPVALIVGPLAALIGIVAIFFVFRRKSVDKSKSMYSARRSQIEHKVRAARQRTLAPQGKAEKPPEAPPEAAPTSIFAPSPAPPRVTYEPSAYKPPPAAAPPAREETAASPWDAPPPAAPQPAAPPASQPAAYEAAAAPVEEVWAPAPAAEVWTPAPAPVEQPRPSEPVWTPAPAPSEPATPVEPKHPATPAAAPGSWSVVSEAAKESASTEDQTQRKGKTEASTAAWSLASGDAPGIEDGDDVVKAPSPAVAIAQYAVLVVGLVMVLIGVFVMIANSHVT
jgi:hypothetical protein